MVDPSRHRVEFVRASIGPDEVVAPLRVAGLVGQRVEVQIGQGHRVEPLAGDDVAREGLALDPSVGQTHRRPGVVDDDALGEQGREVAPPLRFCGHGEGAGLGELVLEPLVGDHEERAVPAVIAWQHERPSQRAAEAVVAQRRSRLPRPVQEEVVSGDRVGPVELVGGTVPVVAAALEDHVDRRAGGVALLGVVSGGLHLELLHRVGGRHVGYASSMGHVGRAVERELVPPRGAVGHDGGGPGVVEGAGELQIPGVGNAGGQPGEHEWVAVGEGQEVDASGVDDLSRGAGRGLQEWGAGPYLHRRLLAAGFDGQVHGQAIRHPHLHLPHRLLEARHLGRHGVPARSQVEQCVLAARIGHGPGGHVGGHVCRYHCGTRHGGARAVLHFPGDRTPGLLGRRPPGQHEQQRCQRGRDLRLHRPLPLHPCPREQVLRIGTPTNSPGHQLLWSAVVKPIDGADLRLSYF